MIAFLTLLSAFMLALPFYSLAQKPQTPKTPQETPFRFRRLGTEQGLAQNTVFDVLQDRKGFLWIATGDGLCRWDGYNVKTWRHDPKDSTSLPPAQITSLLYDQTGTLWIGTLRGVYRFDTPKSNFRKFALQPTPHLQSRKVISLTVLEHGLKQDSDGTIYIAAEEGLFLIDTLKHSTVSVISRIKGFDSILYRRCTFFPNAQGETILAVDEGERGTSIGLIRTVSHLFRIRNGTLIEINLPHNTKARFYPAYRDANYQWWLWKEKNSVYRWDERIQSMISEKRVALADIYSVIDDRNAQHWISDDFNFSLMSSDYKSFMVLRHEKYDSSTISQGYVSTWMGLLPNGTVWLSSDGGGVNFQIPPAKFVSAPDLPWILAQTNSVRGIAADMQGNLWIGALGSGLLQYSPKFQKYILKSKAGLYKPVFCDAKGTIWSADDVGGLLEVCNAGTAQEKILSHTTNEQTNWFLSITDDNLGALWLGGMTHLCRFDKKTKKITHKFAGFSAPEVFRASNNLIWVGNNDGVYVFNPANYQELNFAPNGQNGSGYRHFAFNPQDSLSLSDNTVKCFMEDDKGRMWIGTVNGLNIMDTSSGKCRRYFTTDGLPNNYVYGILTDGQENVWISTNKGLAKFSESKQTWRVYTVKDGLQSLEFNRSAFCKLADGRLVFGGVNGFNIFRPEEVQDNTTPPPVAIVELEINDRPYQQVLSAFAPNTPQYGIREVSELTALELGYNDNTLTFDFAALDFTDPAKNLYAYKMDGIDKDWVQAGTLRKTRYAGLSPGEYVFRVRACNNDGVWNEVGTALRLRILPPFWRTAWFYTLCGISLIAVVGGGTRFVVRQRFRQQVERLEAVQMLEREQMQRELVLERERGRIAKDIHDEVGPGMMRIAVLAEAVQEGNIGSSEHISATAQEVIDAMNGIIWMTNPKNDTLDNLTAYIQEKAGDWFDRIGADKGIVLDFVLPEDVPALALEGNVRRNLYLSVKEALNNALKYSEASRVEISLTMHGEKGFVWRVSDDGRGFEADDVSRFSNGLANMRSRMEEIGGECVVESALGKGTVVRFVVGDVESFVETHVETRSMLRKA